jgi:beta-glucosidase
MSALEFPPGFLWGAATAAHQVEGRNYNNDWWPWEHLAGRVRNDDTSRTAADWWGDRFYEDFDRAKSLGMNAFRLSVEWSRIEPNEGEWDVDALKKYRSMLEALRKRDMTPFVTLHHFTNPLWLVSRGGWEDPRVARYFARFARHVVSELGELCGFWITINEPNVYAYMGYSVGQWPPGVKNVRRSFKVIKNMLSAHAGAYYAIKDVRPAAHVGVSHHRRFFRPHRDGSSLDRLTVRFRNRVFNQLIMSALEEGYLGFPLGFRERVPEIRGTQDFLGLNYYFSDPVLFDPGKPGEMFGRVEPSAEAVGLKRSFSSVGNIEPPGLERTLFDLARYGKPIYITENGVFDDGKELQCRYLVSHLSAVHRALAAGADVRGYFWWTLTDNFEWAEGFTPKFGLYHLDIATQVRTPRPVADLYARIIKENGIADEMKDGHGRTY